MTPLYTVLSAILGLIIGSFLSMLIPRLHSGETGICFGRSHCAHCKKNLKAHELIPLLSYLLQRGKCKSCKKLIPIWYPLIEFGTALIFLTLFIYINDIKTFLIYTPTFTVLSFIFFYDLRYKEIHDAVMIPGILIALITAVYYKEAPSALIGAGIAGGFFGLQYLLSKGKWLGSGDIEIGIFMGLLLGAQKTPLALMISYLIGSIIAIILLLSKKANTKSTVPLGPFLVAGTLITFIFGDYIIQNYFYL